MTAGPGALATTRPSRDDKRVPPISAARCFARFVRDLTLGHVPAPVVETASLLVLDTVGNALAAAGEDFAVPVLATARRLGGPAESTLIGTSDKVAAANAVLANGTLAHGLDFDDTREDAIVHTGSVAVTTALAVGEACGASGRAVLEAVIAGVEVMCRVGLAVPGQLHAHHFHPTAIAGSFAAAAAAGKLLGSTEDQIVHALGICGSQAAGIIEYLVDGSWTKRLHPGWVGHAGVVATLLAQSGFTGPETVLEGPHGVYQAFAGGHDQARLDALLASHGTTWELARLTFKPYPCGSIAHPYMDCALTLRERHRIAPEQVVSVRCRTAAGPVPRLWEPLASKWAPPNGYAAKFSLPYLIGTMLVKGRAGLAEFGDGAVRDEAVLRIARRVTYELDPTIDYPRRFIGDVRIRLADGREVAERQEHYRGGPEHPMPRAELEAKFRGNAGLRLPAPRVERLRQGLTALAAEPRLSGIVESLSP